MIGWWLRRRKKAADEAAKAAALARSRKEREDKDFDDFLEGKIKVVEPEVEDNNEPTELDKWFAKDLPVEKDEPTELDWFFSTVSPAQKKEIAKIEKDLDIRAEKRQREAESADAEKRRTL